MPFGISISPKKTSQVNRQLQQDIGRYGACLLVINVLCLASLHLLFIMHGSVAYE